jgi:uncharacterized membrane protein (DUF373 family)
MAERTPTRRLTVALLVLTLFPIIYLAGFALFFVWLIIGLRSHPPFHPPDSFLAFFPLHLLVTLEIFALLAYYLRDLHRSKRVPTERKPVWAMILLSGNVLAMPVYWYLYFWRDAEPPGPA